MFTFFRRKAVEFLDSGHIKNKQYPYSCDSVCFMNVRGISNKTSIEMLSKIIINIIAKYLFNVLAFLVVASLPIAMLITIYYALFIIDIHNTTLIHYS